MASTLIIAFLMITAVAVLILSLKYFQKKAHTKKLNEEKSFITDIVWKNKLELAEKEIINGCFFGIDTVNFVLLYISFHKESPEVHLINLWDVNAVKPATLTFDIWEQRKGKAILAGKEVDKLFVEISFSNDPKNLPLMVYQLEDGMQDLSVLKQRADYWAKLINKCIHEIPKQPKPSYSKKRNVLLIK
ncbi:MAG: hypothetical protein ABIW38_06765 [Ferruginibacter sp.]